VAKSLAREVLLQALTGPDVALGGQRERLLTLLGRIDSTEALRLASGDGVYQRRVQLAAAASRLREDFGSGMAMLYALGDPVVTVRTVLDLAEEAARPKPDLAKRCVLAAHEALPQVSDTRQRAILAARLGADMLPVDATIGKSLLQSATDEIKQLASRGPVPERAVVASYLFQVDPAAAVALIGESPADDMSKIILARYLARTDPDQAMALAAKLNYPGMAYRTMVLYFRPERFEQARDIALRLGGPDNDPVLMRLCFSAPRDRLPSWIEEIRDRLEPEPPGEGFQSSGEREAYGMALLALLARRLGYPEARDLMLRAGLNRMHSFLWDDSLEGSGRGLGRYEPRLKFARVVAMMKPELAKRLVPADLSPDDQDYGLFVATLAGLDPPRAAKLLGAMPTESRPQKATYQKAAVAVAEALLLPAEEREATLMRDDPQWPCLPAPEDINSTSWQ
jgi:hypothetical protein